MNRRQFLQLTFGASLGLNVRRASGRGAKKPNIDRLAQDGSLLTDACACAGNCARK